MTKAISDLKCKRYRPCTNYGPPDIDLLVEDETGDYVKAIDVFRSLHRMTKSGRLTVDTANRIIQQLGLK